jgi:hypothetical protein
MRTCSEFVTRWPQRLIDLARTADTPSSELVFQYTGSGKNIAVLQPLVGSSGWLACARLAKDLATGLSDAERPIFEELNARNGRWFDLEIEKLERWTGDRRDGLKSLLDPLDVRIKEAKKAARFAPSLPEKLPLQREVKPWRAGEAKRGARSTRRAASSRATRRSCWTTSSGG